MKEIGSSLGIHRFSGYTKCDDGLYRKIVEFKNPKKPGKYSITTLVRNCHGKLLKTDHGLKIQKDLQPTNPTA